MFLLRGGIRGGGVSHEGILQFFVNYIAGQRIVCEKAK